ncbi:MAG TPA: hypothetical protein VMA83_06320 [Solirubrobacteraceae bacterium]|nr:hypothetical protein [Solirubrobacteraceae bacterium]
MSPLAVRRMRAERMLRSEYDALRGRVLRAARAKLAASDAALDPADLEACYAQAWHGLYGEVLGGARIENPAGWLVLVTYRRAIDEHRAQMRARRGAVSLDAQLEAGAAAGRDVDLAGALDDRRRLRAVMEGLGGELEGLEREAAVLCYLHGLTRAEAASRMGVSERRMRRLMEGRGDGKPGVAAKVGRLLDAVVRDEWCERQASLMRAYAFGVLDPDGERHRLAALHLDECPACRAQVAALRGLAAALPPTLVPWTVARSLVGRGVHAGAGAGSGAGGGWLVASGTGAGKIAVGCALALGIGAGCAVLGGAAHAPEHRPAPHARAALARPPASAWPRVFAASAPGPRTHAAARARAARATNPVEPARISATSAAAEREFGPEQPAAGRSAAPAAAPRASVASAPARGAQAAAEREFTPG